MYEYQNQFNYAVWGADTTVELCSVPWDAEYRDVVTFDSASARDAYFSGARVGEIVTGMVYLRYGEPIVLSIPFDMATQSNYLIAKNAIQPVPPYGSDRTADVFYYFITDVKYVAPNTTQMNVQLDAWQTYSDRLHFDTCYVERGHIGMANERATLTTLSTYMTTPEGLNQGNEYGIAKTFVNSWLDDNPPWVIIMSTAALNGSFGDVSSPNLTTSKGTVNDGLPSGAECYAISGGDFTSFMSQISQYPWISQCISMITVVPRDLCAVDESNPVHLGGSGVAMYGLIVNPSIGASQEGVQVTVEDFFGNFQYPDRYKGLLKFYTYPYAAVELTSYAGGEVMLKPECMGINKLSDGTCNAYINVLSVCAPPEIRACVYPEGYNRVGDVQNGSSEYHYFTDGQSIKKNEYNEEEMDMCVWVSNFPQISIVNDQYINYMASNRNWLNYQNQSASWSEQKALRGASTAYANTGVGMENSLQNQAVSNNLNWGMNQVGIERNNWQGLQGVASSGLGALGGIAGGNLGQAVSGLANMGISAYNTTLNNDWQNRSTAMQVGAANQTTANNVGAQGQVRDNNKAYADYAAQGDYANAIAGIQARVEDAKLTQPSTSGQNGGDVFNFAQGYTGWRLKFKRPKNEYVRQIGNYWFRYGYEVDQFMTPSSFKCMTNFTYWKMKYVCLSGPGVPESFKESIRGIFEKGVTIWSDPKKMNVIDVADNEPLEGVRY